MSEPGFTRL